MRRGSDPRTRRTTPRALLPLLRLSPRNCSYRRQHSSGRGRGAVLLGLVICLLVVGTYSSTENREQRGFGAFDAGLLEITGRIG